MKIYILQKLNGIVVLMTFKNQPLNPDLANFIKGSIPDIKHALALDGGGSTFMYNKNNGGGWIQLTHEGNYQRFSDY